MRIKGSIPALLVLALGLLRAPVAVAGIDVVDEPEANTPPPKFQRPPPPPPVETEVPPIATPARLPRRAPSPPPDDVVGEDHPTFPGSNDKPQPAGRTGLNAPASTASSQAPTPTAPQRADAGVGTGTNGAAGNPAPPPLILPKGSLQDLLTHFRARQQALLEQNPRRVDQETAALRELKSDLGFPDFATAGEALAREGERRLQSHLTAQARGSAQLAVQLAPDLPAGYSLLGRAEIREAGLSGLPEAGSASMQAIRAELSQPPAVRALLTNLALSALWAALAACALVLGLLVLYSLRYALHDFHHLFPRAASPVQTYLLGITLLALPWLFGLGPFAVLASGAAVAWLYVRRQGQAVLGATLLLLVAAPFAVGSLARLSVISPLGFDLWSVERDLDSEQAATRLQKLAEEPNASPAVLFALGHRSKRLGQLEDAEAYYRRALAAAPSGIFHPYIQNNLANVLLLKGDLKGAQALYESAIEADPGKAALYFNLGQAFSRLLQLDQAQEAQRRSLELDRELIEHHMGQDLHANAFLVDIELPWSEVAAAGAEGDRAEVGVRRQAEARIFGPLQGISTAIAIFTGLVLLLLSLMRSRLSPSTSCERCGRPVCNRCDPGLADDRLCGQCVNVFVKRAVSDPPARIRKEARVKAYQALRLRVARLLSVILGAGQVALGNPLAGAAVLFLMLFLLLNALGMFLPGLATPFRPPFVGLLPTALALASGLLFLPAYIFSVRDTFAKTQ
jgi:tetratricopeptide (TPR) repeat protein